MSFYNAQKSNSMKAGRIWIIFVFLMITLGSTKVNAQVVAVGRVFAEVVESVSASSATISSFELSKSQESVSVGLEAVGLDLGAITINSGNNITCNIVLTAASLKDELGNSLILNPIVNKGLLSAPVSSNGIQVVQLGATPVVSQDQASGVYEGSYTVIFAFN